MSSDKPTVKHAIVKDAFIYTAANYCSDALGILVSIFSKRFYPVAVHMRWCQHVPSALDIWSAGGGKVARTLDGRSRRAESFETRRRF